MRHLTTLKFIDIVAREGSIRRAAETLAITSTALNRRVLQMEEELGQPIFERLASGVRLNTAGELFVQHIRAQIADLARVQSQIADLSGIRRGHIRIVSSADALRHFLPAAIASYRKAHPAVTFELRRVDAAVAEASLADLEADIAVVFAPVRAAHFHVTAALRQQLHCLMRRDHGLAEKTVLRLRDCVGHTAILPGGDSGIGAILDAGLIRRNFTANTIIESDSFEFIQNYLAHESALSFQIPVGMSADILDGTHPSLVARPIDTRDVVLGSLHIGQLRGRVLPVAAAKFMDDLISQIITEYPADSD